jgi:hypothetical protein
MQFNRRGEPCVRPSRRAFFCISKLNLEQVLGWENGFCRQLEFDNPDLRLEDTLANRAGLKPATSTFEAWHSVLLSYRFKIGGSDGNRTRIA